MAPAAHTSQTPSSGNVDNGAAITTGVRFTVASALTVAKIAFWVPTTNSGTYTVGLYQTTADDDPAGSGTGTLLASASVASGSVTPDGWAEVPITPQALSTGVVYTAARHASSGRYVATAGAFTSAGISGNGVTLFQDGSDPNPPGLGTMRNGVFVEGGALAYPVSQFGQADYFVDVVLAAGQEAALGTAAETDTALALARTKVRVAGLAGETDTAPALGRTKSRTVGTATSTEAALSLGRVKVLALGTATETGSALALAAVKRRAVGTALETDTALPLAGATPLVPTVYRVGPPELRWSVGPPELKWSVGPVEV